MNKVLGCIAALPEDEVLNVARPWRLRDSVGLFRWACHSQTLWPSWWWVWQRLQEACHGVTTHRLRSNGILSSATSLEPPQTQAYANTHAQAHKQRDWEREPQYPPITCCHSKWPITPFFLNPVGMVDLGMGDRGWEERWEDRAIYRITDRIGTHNTTPSVYKKCPCAEVGVVAIFEVCP